MSVQLDIVLLSALLFGAGIYLVLAKRFVSVLFGFILLSNAANLLILSTAGDPTLRGPPLLDGAHGQPVDPLPQALILTAIVIGFGVLAYLSVLFYRLHADRGATTVSEAVDDPPAPPVPTRNPGRRVDIVNLGGRYD